MKKGANKRNEVNTYGAHLVELRVVAPEHEDVQRDVHEDHEDEAEQHEVAPELLPRELCHGANRFGAKRGERVVRPRRELLQDVASDAGPGEAVDAEDERFRDRADDVGRFEPALPARLREAVGVVEVDAAVIRGGAVRAVRVAAAQNAVSDLRPRERARRAAPRLAVPVPHALRDVRSFRGAERDEHVVLGAHLHFVDHRHAVFETERPAVVLRLRRPVVRRLQQPVLLEVLRRELRVAVQQRVQVAHGEHHRDALWRVPRVGGVVEEPLLAEHRLRGRAGSRREEARAGGDG